MKKKSYSSSAEGGPQIVGPLLPLTDSDTATESAGRAGVNLIEMTSDYDSTNPDKYESGARLDQDLLELLTHLGDGLDEADERAMANFADFLIQKFAQSKVDVEETKPIVMFNKLMIRVANAELPNTNQILKKLTKIYSRTLNLEFYKNRDLEKSQNSAYRKVLHRADQYLSES